MNEFIRNLEDRLRETLTFDGIKRVFEDNQELTSNLTKDRVKPEALTKQFLIEPVIDLLGLKRLPEKIFDCPDGIKRNVDYYLKNDKGIKFLCEAKPLNADLFLKSTEGAVNQVVGLFKLAEVKENYEFGIATDGIKWIFIDKNARIVYKFDISEQFENVKKILIGQQEVLLSKIEEEISKKFYDWYNALLNGGTYKDHNNKKRKISNNNCLVENIIFVANKEDSGQIAQTILDRLIFIKFLQSKGIISQDVLEYLSKLDETQLNDELKQLFFHVLNVEKEKRIDVKLKFKEIPYLNGSLFLKTEAENRNSDYKIKADILRAVITFLNTFKFIHKDDSPAEYSLNPEILGYIFERAMTAEDRKGTGSYYTPKIVTQYISENTINKFLVEKTNGILKEGSHKPNQSIKVIDTLYQQDSKILKEVMNKVLIHLKICDNACGSGAFLLSAADILFDIYQNLNSVLDIGLSEIEIKKSILKNNLYGVDINPNAIEIAKLRLWLWLVGAYEPDRIEPLPNIDYNLRVGNSLTGYVDITKFKLQKLNLADWMSEDGEESLKMLLTRREEIIREYKDASSEKAKELKSKIEEAGKKTRRLLDKRLFQEISGKFKINSIEFEKLKLFHWGFEFPEVFSLRVNGTSGFDIINGNPPYGNTLSKMEKTMLYSFVTSDANEVAANFIERSLQILRESGHIGLIVANSIAINASTAGARELIRKTMTLSNMALFGTRPAKIFADAEIRVLVFLGKKDNPTTDGVIFTTEAIKFTQEMKPTLLDNLKFESTRGLTLGEAKIGDELKDSSLPKVGNAMIRNILLRLKNQSQIVIKDRINLQGFQEKMQFRKTGGYWLNALEKIPYSSTKIETLRFETVLERDFAILLINSSLFYLYWSTYSNLRDFPLSLLEKFPFPSIEKLHENKKPIGYLKKKLTTCLLNAFIADRGRVGEFRTGSCKPVIDEVDMLLGKLYGFTKEQTTFTITYDAHIRKA